jgi:hypothetical protein
MVASKPSLSSSLLADDELAGTMIIIALDLSQFVDLKRRTTERRGKYSSTLRRALGIFRRSKPARARIKLMPSQSLANFRWT